MTLILIFKKKKESKKIMSCLCKTSIFLLAQFLLLSLSSGLTVNYHFSYHCCLRAMPVVNNHQPEPLYFIFSHAYYHFYKILFA